MAVSVMSETYKVLLELLVNLPTNINNWSQDKFSNNEAIIERHFININDHIDHVSVIYSEIQQEQGQSNQIILLLRGLDELLSYLNNYHKVYDTRMLNFGTVIPHSRPCLEVKNTPGRPKILLDEQQILNLKELNMTWKAIANLLGVHEKTLQRKRKEFNINLKRYTDLTDEELDNLMNDLVKSNPNAGERMIQGSLVGLGHRIQRWRIRASLNRVCLLYTSPSPRDS